MSALKTGLKIGAGLAFISGLALQLTVYLFAPHLMKQLFSPVLLSNTPLFFCLLLGVGLALFAYALRLNSEGGFLLPADVDNMEISAKQKEGSKLFLSYPPRRSITIIMGVAVVVGLVLSLLAAVPHGETSNLKYLFQWIAEGVKNQWAAQHYAFLGFEILAVMVGLVLVAAAIYQFGWRIEGDDEGNASASDGASRAATPPPVSTAFHT